MPSGGGGARTCAFNGCDVVIKRRDVTYCSMRHARWARAPQQKYSPKICTQCGGEFRKRPKETRERWARRDHCSWDCRYPDRGKPTSAPRPVKLTNGSRRPEGS